MISSCSVALLLVSCLAPAFSQSTTCGVEGYKPCDGSGCRTDYIPHEGEDVPEGNWYPIGDSFVPAPKGYRVNEGICTRCGNIYEPACPGPKGKPLCLKDMHGNIQMVPTEDGFCVPAAEEVGCGTTGTPPCPLDIVAEEGTLAILTAPNGGDSWKIKASVGIQKDGCLYSEHNRLMRFVKAQPEWLPEGHKCANVCIPCGHTGYPVCPFAPACSRRRSLKDTTKFLDGPTGEEDGMCVAVPCGADTVHGPLPPCPADLLQELDADKDGCAEPYGLDSSKVCGNKEEPDYSKPPPMLNTEEFSCVIEGFMNFTTESRNQLSVFQNNTKVAAYLDSYKEGKCVPCGRADQAPCTYMDFLGCMVQEGYILDPDTGLCSLAPCGGAHNDSSSPPWNDPRCKFKIPTYTPADQSPVNSVTKCNFFHNLKKEGDLDVCKPCGWPGNMCEKECIYGFEFDPVGDPAHGQGRFTVRPEFRTGGALTGHCQPIYREKLYPDQCPDAKRVDDPDAPAPVINGTISDSTFGTDDNVDSCQQGLQTVLDVYLDTCPDGGTPVRKFAQCGGVDYSGPTCCYGYSVCVKKNEFFSICEDANVPGGVVPWHLPCKVNGIPCELGSECKEGDFGAFCNPVDDVIAQSPGSSRRSASAGATAGAVLGVLALLILAAGGGFVLGRKKGIPHGSFRLRSWAGDAETYATQSNAAAGLKHDDHPAEAPGNTYLDLAAATEAEALSSRKASKGQPSSPNQMNLPTSDFGIGRRA